MEELNCMTKVVLIFSALLFTVPLVARKFTTQEEIKPIGGIENLSFKGKMMHLMVHFSQFPMESSLLLGTLVSISFYLSQLLPDLSEFLPDLSKLSPN
jgi:hypothetical protein